MSSAPQGGVAACDDPAGVGSGAPCPPAGLHTASESAGATTAEFFLNAGPDTVPDDVDKHLRLFPPGDACGNDVAHAIIVAMRRWHDTLIASSQQVAPDDSHNAGTPGVDEASDHTPPSHCGEAIPVDVLSRCYDCWALCARFFGRRMRVFTEAPVHRFVFKPSEASATDGELRIPSPRWTAGRGFSFAVWVRVPVSVVPSSNSHQEGGTANKEAAAAAAAAVATQGVSSGAVPAPSSPGIMSSASATSTTDAVVSSSQRSQRSHSAATTTTSVGVDKGAGGDDAAANAPSVPQQEQQPTAMPTASSTMGRRFVPSPPPRQPTTSRVRGVGGGSGLTLAEPSAVSHGTVVTRTATLLKLHAVRCGIEVRLHWSNQRPAVQKLEYRVSNGPWNAVHADVRLRRGRWSLVTVTHSYPYVGRSMATLYVDGLVVRGLGPDHRG